VLGLLCSGFPVFGGLAKDLLMVSSRTLTAAGAAALRAWAKGGADAERRRHGSGIRTAAAAAL